MTCTNTCIQVTWSIPQVYIPRSIPWSIPQNTGCRATGIARSSTESVGPCTPCFMFAGPRAGPRYLPTRDYNLAILRLQHESLIHQKKKKEEEEKEEGGREKKRKREREREKEKEKKMLEHRLPSHRSSQVLHRISAVKRACLHIGSFTSVDTGGQQKGYCIP